MPAPLPTPAVALPLLLAGDCRVTLVGRTSGTRYTYRIEGAPPNPRYPRSGPAWFVKALVGPDNDADYRYIGMLVAPDADTAPRFRLTGASPVARIADDARIAGLDWMFRAAAAYDTNPHARTAWEQVEVWHRDTCARCGRALTDPASIAARLGPECRRLLGVPTPDVTPVAATPAPAVEAPAVEAAPEAPKARKGRAKATVAPAPVPEVAPAAHPLAASGGGFMF